MTVSVFYESEVLTEHGLNMPNCKCSPGLSALAAMTGFEHQANQELLA